MAKQPQMGTWMTESEQWSLRAVSTGCDSQEKKLLNISGVERWRLPTIETCIANDHRTVHRTR